eukprot:890824_1
MQQMQIPLADIIENSLSSTHFDETSSSFDDESLQYRFVQLYLLDPSFSITIGPVVLCNLSISHFIIALSCLSFHCRIELLPIVNSFSFLSDCEILDRLLTRSASMSIIGCFSSLNSSDKISFASLLSLTQLLFRPGNAMRVKCRVIILYRFYCILYHAIALLHLSSSN